MQERLVRVARRVRTLVGRAGPEPEVESPQFSLLKVFGAEPVPAELVASYDGFNLHAATAFEAHQRLAPCKDRSFCPSCTARPST